MRFLYVLPTAFSHEIKVEFWSKGLLAGADTAKNCKELYTTDRLVAVLGGTGSSLGYLNGQSITVPEYVIPRPWEFSATWRVQQYLNNPNAGIPPSSYPRGYRGGAIAPSGSALNGNIRLVNLDADHLPDNPEGYGSLSMLAMMSDITENTLKKQDVQDAINLWVHNGGHLLMAGGGVSARLQAPFFTRLLPGDGVSQAEQRKNTDGGTATIIPRGTGWVTQLDYDPDRKTSTDWRKAAGFLGKIIALTPNVPFSLLFDRQIVNNIIMPRNLRPPDLRLIVAFLLVYLVLLVPVNYFVLRKIDRRELAWITTPVIVLLFTVGAYGIGKWTKGSRLILNTVSFVETSGAQTAAEATSNLLIFSPSRTSYQLALGDTGLMVADAAFQGSDVDQYRRQQSRQSESLALNIAGSTITADNINVNMWDFRQLVMSHRVDLGQGFTANLRKGKPASTPRATGTVTNHTPYGFALCELYVDGALVNKFSLNAGQTVTVEASTGTPAVKALGLDEQHMLEVLDGNMGAQFAQRASLKKGFLLVAYTADPRARIPVQVSRHAPTSAIMVMAVHL